MGMTVGESWEKGGGCGVGNSGGKCKHDMGKHCVGEGWRGEGRNGGGRGVEGVAWCGVACHAREGTQPVHILCVIFPQGFQLPFPGADCLPSLFRCCH